MVPAAEVAAGEPEVVADAAADGVVLPLAEGGWLALAQRVAEGLRVESQVCVTE